MEERPRQREADMRPLRVLLAEERLLLYLVPVVERNPTWTSHLRDAPSSPDDLRRDWRRDRRDWRRPSESRSRDCNLIY